MKGFLEEVALDLYTRYGEQLSQCCMMFPSRRARLFFVDALSEIATRPIWQPQWVSIDGLMAQISGLEVGDRMRLVTELFKIYKQYHPNETFDKFYFWGDMLLNDFDTIDKYQIDALSLFSNIKDLKELEADLSYLTPEQELILQSFWRSLGEEENFSQTKRRFLEIWKTLGPIYTQFRQRLTDLGIAYTGMVHRAAAEKLQTGAYELEEPLHFVVVGFNALSTCERQLFQFLSSHSKTDFYWDSDDYYQKNKSQEAGMFIRQNCVEFPQAEPSKITSDNMSKPKTFTSVAAVSNAVQCKWVAEILKELSEKQGPLGKETAVVLTDENLLMPLLYSLPKDIGGVNVTMGYPLKITLTYTFIERLLELQKHVRRRGEGWAFYHVDVMGLLSHPYLQTSFEEKVRDLKKEIVDQRRISVEESLLHLNELLTTVFTPTHTWQDLSDYLIRVLKAVGKSPTEEDDAAQKLEFLAVTAEEITKLRNSLDMCDVDLSLSVYSSLLRRHLQTVRIPFEGEPLEGIQVMGILETRNLDFRNVIILSMTDDNFPGNRMAQNSYIPYNLRAAYSLPTPEHHEGVFAYYFYRLIQRAETVHMLYCSHADEKSTGETSRYIRQLDYESGMEIRKMEVGVDVNLVDSKPIVVEKDERVMKALNALCNEEKRPILSPSAFTKYVVCPLQFYFQFVARLSPDDEMTEDVDSAMFGTILHDAAEALYTPLKDMKHPGELLQNLLKGDAVEQAVVKSINKNFLKDDHATQTDYTGNVLLVKDIVIRYLREGIMAYDIAHDEFTVRGCEQIVSYNYPIEDSEGKERKVKFWGVADRVDELDDGTLRIVDYKTGGVHLEFSGLDSLFNPLENTMSHNILQTLLYSMMLYHSQKEDAVPSLFYVRQMNDKFYEPYLVDKPRRGEKGADGKALKAQKGVRYSAYKEQFEALLSESLKDLFNPMIPFQQTEKEEACTYCDFKNICKR